MTNVIIKQDVRVNYWNIEHQYMKVSSYTVSLWPMWLYYTARYKGHLISHTKAKHQGVKFPCDQCDEAMRWSNLLRYKKSKHEGVRFPCDQCDYKANFRSHLTSHIKSIHEGVNFPCDYCDYKAKRRSNLLRHKNNTKNKVQGHD